MSRPEDRSVRPMVRTVSAVGPKCLGDQYRTVLRHFGTGAEVSPVQIVLGPMCP